jgi:hypothetical protein
VWYFLIFLDFWDTVLLCSPDWLCIPGTPAVL